MIAGYTRNTDQYVRFKKLFSEQTLSQFDKHIWIFNCNNDSKIELEFWREFTGTLTEGPPMGNFEICGELYSIMLFASPFT